MSFRHRREHLQRSAAARTVLACSRPRRPSASSMKISTFWKLVTLHSLLMGLASLLASPSDNPRVLAPRHAMPLLYLYPCVVVMISMTHPRLHRKQRFEDASSTPPLSSSPYRTNAALWHLSAARCTRR
ncbi:hypothetical protein R3P38DRAFT_3057208 [Favolaschia claudopus]|uniref:Uncharacterized protein n=1 Tax=Favolaschia claudopus TaxID=2862362 RepID=A0AAW0A527_9AGAR